MSLFRFNADQFFDETVLPTIEEDPHYSKGSTVPLLFDTLPVLDFDDRHHFTYHQAQLNYYALSRTVSVGVVDLNGANKLPRRVQLSDVALPGEAEFDRIATAQKGANYVIGLHNPETDAWSRIDKNRGIARSLLLIIEAKAKHQRYKFVSTEQVV